MASVRAPGLADGLWPHGVPARERPRHRAPGAGCRPSRWVAHGWGARLPGVIADLGTVLLAVQRLDGGVDVQDPRGVQGRLHAAQPFFCFTHLHPSGDSCSFVETGCQSGIVPLSLSSTAGFRIIGDTHRVTPLINPKTLACQPFRLNARHPPRFFGSGVTTSFRHVRIMPSA